MKVFTLATGELQVNTYFLVDESTDECVIIDGGEDFEAVMDTASKLGVKIVADVLTHAHYDHAGNAKRLQESGVKIFVSAIDAPKLTNGDNLAHHAGKFFESFVPDCLFEDGQTLEFGNVKLKVMITPGHTNGSSCFITDNSLFTGDTLFYRSAGRVDFPTGNAKQLLQSLKNLASLDGNFTVYPGHGETTTLQFERENNYFINYDKN